MEATGITLSRRSKQKGEDTSSVPLQPCRYPVGKCCSSQDEESKLVPSSGAVVTFPGEQRMSSQLRSSLVLHGAAPSRETCMLVLAKSSSPAARVHGQPHLGSKDNFPPMFLNSYAWANNRINMKQINRRKYPNFITDVHGGCAIRM